MGKRGAAMIPFCTRYGEALFLFHRTFSGRRAGCLVDFGGGSETGEDYRQTAIREFVEETDTMFFSTDPALVVSTRQRVSEQLPLVEVLFDNTRIRHPDWWCARQQRDWRTYFVEFDYRDVTAMNRAWAEDDGTRFRKRRELVWVPADTLCRYYSDLPERLWKRVRQLDNAMPVIRSIVKCLQAQA